MTADKIKLAGCVLARADRGNDGLSLKEAVNMIQELVPNITRVSAWRQMQRYVMPPHAAIGVLKRATQKVQATTSDRMNINVAQQYHWHWAVDEVHDYLWKKNTGLYQKTGKTFGEVMPEFLLGLDKMCLMSDAHGNLRVVASVNKKK
jgi:hypothetical protein